MVKETTSEAGTAPTALQVAPRPPTDRESRARRDEELAGRVAGGQADGVVHREGGENRPGRPSVRGRVEFARVDQAEDRRAGARGEAPSKTQAAAIQHPAKSGPCVAIASAARSAAASAAPRRSWRGGSRCPRRPPVPGDPGRPLRGVIALRIRTLHDTPDQAALKVEDRDLRLSASSSQAARRRNETFSVPPR